MANTKCVGLIALLLAPLATGACRSRAYNADGQAGTKEVPFSTVPRRFVQVTGVVGDPTLRLLTLRSRVRLVAERAGEGAPRGCAGKDSADAVADVIGRGVASDGSVELLARSTLEGSAFTVDVPARLGALIDRCRFRIDGGLTMDFEALTEKGTRIKFQALVVASELESGLRTNRIIERPSLPVVVESESESVVGQGSSLAVLWSGILGAAKSTSGPLPTEPALSTGTIGLGVVGNALGLDLRDERVRADQMRTLVSQSDFRENTTKAFHPFGVCAKGRWIIEGSNGFSGLFSKGTNIPALVRFSGAGNNATSKADFGIVHRMTGMAIKLFPTGSDDAVVETQQILTFDDAGPMGSGSPWFLFNAPGVANSAFFANWLYGDSIPARGTANSFARAVSHPREAPLTSPATVSGDGTFVKASGFAAPSLVRIQFAGKPRTAKHSDLRTELMAYQGGELAFDLFLYPKETEPNDLKEHSKNRGPWPAAGRLVVDAPIVLSDACDKTLHFGHSPH